MDPIVGIDTGLIRGTITQNFIGEPVYAFLGVPYGKPPINDLRFKTPQPAEPWNGVRNAVENCPACFQHDLFSNQLVGSEDCLCLNVHTKRLGSPQCLLPVMLFLHGGAFLMGESRTSEYDPAFLMTEDIVFVSINYRVGVLGFLSLNDTSLGVPGNAGLKDQILALEWIQRNIKNFGGDPKRVTVFGQSAGSAAINYHILSPRSKGLFHRAILQSGSVLNPWPHLHPRNLEILDYLNIKYENDSQILQEFTKLPLQELLGAQRDLFRSLPDSRHRLFGPTVEKPNDEAFLTRNPIDVMISGDYNKVPIIIGYDSNEGAYESRNDNGTVITYPYVPPQITLPDDAAVRERLLRKIWATYQIDKNRNNVYLAMGDSLFVAGIIGATLNFVETSSEPIYLYAFHLVGSRNFLRHAMNLSDEIEGASHADELGYLFDSADLKGIGTTPGSKELEAVQRLVKLWVNFAKYGNPTPVRKQFKLKWEPVTNNKLFYLHFNETLSIRTNPWERKELWREIYKASNQTKNFMP